MRLPQQQVADSRAQENFEKLQSILTREKWHVIGATGEPAFQNSWAATGGGATVPAFYKDQIGRVWVKGRLGTGASGTNAFTLPVGYRPAAQEFFPLLVSSAIAGVFVSVDSSGNVNITRGAASEAFLQISFLAE